MRATGPSGQGRLNVVVNHVESNGNNAHGYAISGANGAQPGIIWTTVTDSVAANNGFAGFPLRRPATRTGEPAALCRSTDQQPAAVGPRQIRRQAIHGIARDAAVDHRAQGQFDRAWEDYLDDASRTARRRDVSSSGARIAACRRGRRTCVPPGHAKSSRTSPC